MSNGDTLYRILPDVDSLVRLILAHPGLRAHSQLPFCNPFTMALGDRDQFLHMVGLDTKTTNYESSWASPATREYLDKDLKLTPPRSVL